MERRGTAVNACIVLFNTDVLHVSCGDAVLVMWREGRGEGGFTD